MITSPPGRLFFFILCCRLALGWAPSPSPEFKQKKKRGPRQISWHPASLIVVCLITAAVKLPRQITEKKQLPRESREQKTEKHQLRCQSGGTGSAPLPNTAVSPVEIWKETAQILFLRTTEQASFISECQTVHETSHRLCVQTKTVAATVHQDALLSAEAHFHMLEFYFGVTMLLSIL